ncbi:MAG: HAMP domain-containing protein [Chloroflexia bacterium]|nr:HAMP domain-containing protein [Chloroflexia bacterium]
MDYTTSKIKINNSVFFLIAIIAALFALAFISRTISKPLTELEELASKLAEGELPEHSDVKSSDEIGKMAKALNALTNGLMKTSEFASEIGRSNFDSKFEPLSNKDVLGNSLLEMRKSLQSANEEENKRKIEDQERNWTTEGLARFGEILRRHTENIGLLSKDIIQNLVKYLNANQGGIFILNDADPDDVHLELMSAYAYNRENL